MASSAMPRLPISSVVTICRYNSLLRLTSLYRVIDIMFFDMHTKSIIPISACYYAEFTQCNVVLLMSSISINDSATTHLCFIEHK